MRTGVRRSSQIRHSRYVGKHRPSVEKLPVGHRSKSCPVLSGLAGVRGAGAVPSRLVIKASAMAGAAVDARELPPPPPLLAAGAPPALRTGAAMVSRKQSLLWQKRLALGS